MIDRTTRRRLLGISAGIAANLVGCLNAPQERILSIAELNVVESSSNEITLKARIIASVHAGSSDWGTFRDVKIVGYDRDGNEICRADVGVVQPDPRGIEKEFDCQQIPPLFTLTASLSPCDDGVQIGIYEFQGVESDATDYRGIRDRKCDEPTLPTDV